MNLSDTLSKVEAHFQAIVFGDVRVALRSLVVRLLESMWMQSRGSMRNNHVVQFFNRILEVS